MVTPDAIAQVRRFNRTTGECLGAVDDRFLGRRRPMGESRVLWEIGADGVAVRTLRARLGLDSGYTTRVLQSLARQGLVRIQVDRSDRRVRRVTLTQKGAAERAELDRRSDALASGLLTPLLPDQRDALVEAMARVERLLRASMVRFDVEDPASPDAQWCLTQYFSELDARFDRGFDPAHGIPAEPADMTPPAGAFVVARLRGAPIGCGGLTRHAGGAADLRRMWVAPSVRGLGIGARLLAALEQIARDAGARVVRLETNRTLSEAIALYTRAGYVEVRPFSDEPYAHHWFEKRLRGAREPSGSRRGSA